MLQEEKMVAPNLCLKSPKTEEVPVLEDGDSSMIGPNVKVDIMDELEGILGIEDDEKFGDHMLTNVDWDFLPWNEFPNDILKQEYDDEEEDDDDDDDDGNKMKMEELLDECYNDSSIAVKRENLGFWEDEKTLSLNLNYQDVLDAWSDGRSPWADDYSLSTANYSFMGEVPVMKEEKMRREARVLRYKEKRQSRLFSKKIRYQVRKLNAEKRPRLKGRFVKRTPDKIMR